MSGGRPSFTLILPVYNEEAILEENLRVLLDYLGSLSGQYDWDVLVVDDGSTDTTGTIADLFAAGHERVRVLHHFRNFKLGQALRFAFANCAGDYVVTFDVDLSYSPDHIERMLDTIVETRAKIVVASPYMKGGSTKAIPFTRRTASRWANAFLSLASKSGIKTVTGMVRAYDRRFVASLNTKAVDNEINSEIIYKAELMRAYIVEIPAHLDWSGQQDRRRGPVRLRRMTAGFAFSGFLFRPFMFFILPGLVILALSLYTLGWAAYHVFFFYGEATGTFDPRISSAVAAAFSAFPHTFIVGGIGLIVAVQLLALGIVSAQNKRYFEELFHLGTTVKRSLLDDWRP